MVASEIEAAFRAKVCTELRLQSEGKNRYRVLTPFEFDDGDRLVILLKREAGGWVLSDEANTLMHLTYEIDERDLRKGTRQKIISNTLATFGVEEREGELVSPIDDDQYGDALYSFVQALLKISDVTYLSRERARSVFMEEFKEFFSRELPDDRRSFDWHDPEHDPAALYPVDCRVNGMRRPVFIYALNSDAKVRDATITQHMFEKWETSNIPVGVFEDQEKVGRNVLARFSDACDRQFPSLASAKSRFSRWLEDTRTR